MKYFLIVLVTAVLVGIGVRELFPRTVKVPTIPKIVTVYDTVPSLPDWYKDSVSYWKKRKYTTDTVEIEFTNTVVDTQYVPVNSPAEDRPDVWPLLSYHGGSKFGDTAVVTTYSLRSGNAAISKVFIPGVLTDIDAFHEDGTLPRLNYAAFPVCPGPSFWHNLKVAGLGVVVVGGTAAIISLGSKVF